MGGRYINRDRRSRGETIPALMYTNTGAADIDLLDVGIVGKRVEEPLTHAEVPSESEPPVDVTPGPKSLQQFARARSSVTSTTLLRKTTPTAPWRHFWLSSGATRT